MKNIELKSFRRTEGYKNMRTGCRDKELSCYNHLFCGMSLVAVTCFILVFAGVGVVNASVSYDVGTNTIFLENGTNTLASIYSEINDTSVLSYDSGTNTYTLSANISGKNGANADLVLEDATLILNCTATNKYYIKTWSNLTINNMTVKSANYLYPWLIRPYGRWTDPSLSIIDSDFSGGHVIAYTPHFDSAHTHLSTPTIIKNNKFHDIIIEEIEEISSQKFEYILGIHGDFNVDAYIYNNTFENCHIPFNGYNGVIGFRHATTGLVVDKLYISNCSVRTYGLVFFYGTSSKTNSPIISNFEINDCCGNGITGKEWGNVIIVNGTITNLTDDCKELGWPVAGIHLYHSTVYGNTKFWIDNVTIDGSDWYGIASNGQDNITTDIYNVKIMNTGVAAFRLQPEDTDFYITNSLATNYNTKYVIASGYDSEVREYVLADVYVVDKGINPVKNATVTIEPINPDVCDCVINHKLDSLTQTVSLSEGHTPLPAEDETKTVTLLSRRVTYNTDKTYTYNITAEKGGYNATVTVTPDESWYREDPNTYPGAGKGTVIITLPLTTAPSLNITNVNATSITSNSTTITWATDKESDAKVTYTTNPSNLGTHWQNDSLQTLTHTILLSELEIDTPYYFMVYSTDAAGNTANSTVSNFSTPAALPDNATTVILQSPNDVTDNRLKEASPDTVLGSTSFIDVGRINTEGNYRDVIWFNLTQLNSTDNIETAKLSLFWYYTERNTSTTVEIYRPVAWTDNYVTWNTRTNGVAWTNAGGDWYDRTNVAQGTTPYATVTFPVGDADNVYHEFDVTELVQSYVDGTYENTGFFIKANEVSNSYIAFRSSDWTNASEQPKLVVSYGGGETQQNTLSGAVTDPDSTTGIADATVTLTTPEGTEIDTVQADFTGHYEFTDVSAGDYNINATKRGYWPDSNPVTVTADEPATANIVLCQKGDLNTNSEPADAGDLAMMADATVNATLRDETYDLDGDGNPADEADLTLLKDVSVGVAELE